MSTIKKGFLAFIFLCSLMGIGTTYACPQCERDRAAAASDNGDDIEAYIQRRVQSENDF